MPKVTWIQPGEGAETFDIPEGRSLMLGAQMSGVEGILGECGGQAMCATCHVYVDASSNVELPPMLEDEDVMLDTTACERRTNSRLSCQITSTPAIDCIVLRLPEEQL